MASEKNFSIFQGKSLALPIINPPQRRFFIAQVSLRILATALSLAAICVMVTSDQSVVVYEIKFDARFYYVSAFKFLVGANAVTSALSLPSLIFVYVFCRQESNPRSYFFIFLHDIMMMVLEISGCAAATAIGYVGRNGETRLGWMAVCGDVGCFCNKVTISITFSFLAFLSLMAVVITSATQVYSTHCIKKEERENTRTQGK